MKLNIINKQYTPLLEKVESLFQDSSNSIHKARNEIKIIKYKDTKYAVKLFKKPNFINRVAYTFFRNSKAKKSFLHAKKIIDFTPYPIGYSEFFKMGLIERSYYVSKYFNYDFTIRDIFEDIDFKDRNKILKLFALFTVNLHKNSIYHNDFSPGNILIKKEQSSYEFQVVDINRMEFKDLNQKNRAYSFSKLWANDNDLKIITNEYAKIVNIEKDKFFKMALESSHKYKRNKELYKRIKRLFK